MATGARLGMAAALVAGLAACDGAGSRDLSRAGSTTPAAPGVQVAASAGAARPRPRLVDLGAGKCVPCRAMAPVLERLRADYAGRLDVVFIDVWQQPEEGRAYGISLIPTQIFFGPDGRELARHEGFIDREQILARWKALGVEL